MTHKKSKLKEGYYYECKDFYTTLPEEIKVPEYKTEIFPEVMTHNEILETYKIKPYTLIQAAGVVLDIIPTLKNDYKARMVYFKDIDGELYRFVASRNDDGQLSLDVDKVDGDFRYDAERGACFSNEILDTKPYTLEPLETLTLEQAIQFIKDQGFTVTLSK